MKAIINVILVLVIALLAFMLYNAIKEPIAFAEAKAAKKEVVVQKLQTIRRAQEVYRTITGKFASSFDSLAYVLNTGQIPTIKLVEDPEDPTNPDKFTKTTTYTPAKDSIRSFGITNADSLRYVPFAGGIQFEISADTLTYQQTLVSVTEVGTQWKNFMGIFADPKYSKYDAGYEPNATIKFGDMNKPNLAGNWER